MPITFDREDNAYNIIDKMMEKEEIDSHWFITESDIEKYVKPNIEKYYEFILYVLEVCIPETREEKKVKDILCDFMKNIEYQDDSNETDEGVKACI